MGNKYEIAKIYKIVCNQTGLTYVGSTTQTLSRRLSTHKGVFKAWLKGAKAYVTSFKVLEKDDFYIELICMAPCSCKDELHAIEAKYIRSIECVNKCIPGRTRAEYRQDNAEQIKESEKQRRYDNHEKIREYQRQYRNTEVRKQYHIANADKIKAYHEQYAKDHPEKFQQWNPEENKKQMSKPCHCICGETFENKAEHDRSPRHQSMFSFVNKTIIFKHKSN